MEGGDVMWRCGDVILCPSFRTKCSSSVDRSMRSWLILMLEFPASFHQQRCGVVWCGVVWCGVVWCGVVWCGVVWCGVVWCGVVWCGVVWCVVCGVWCGVVCGVVVV